MPEIVDSPQHSGEIRNIQKEGEFPQDLPGRMNAVFSSFNIPIRASIMLLADESGTNPKSLTRSLNHYLKDSAMKFVDNNTVLSHCRNLCKNGFLKEKADGSFDTTEAGKKYGRPIAALILASQVDQDFSLFPVFNRSQPARREERESERTPWTRAKILKALKNGSKRDTDLKLELGVPYSTLGNSFRELTAAGAIDYTAITPQTNEVQVEFQVLPNHSSLDDIKLTEQNSSHVSGSLLKEVARVCLFLAQNHLPISQVNIRERLPEEIQNRWSKESLSTTISGDLSDLVKQGFLEQGRFRGGETQSEAMLTDKGKLVADLIDATEEACQDGPILATLQGLVLPQAVDTIDLLTKEAADLYYPHSISFQLKQGVERRQRLILDSLSETDINTGSTSTDLAKKTGIKVGTIQGDLSSLLKKGRLVRENRNNVYYYKAVPEELAA